VPPKNVADVSAKAGNRSVTIRWTNPPDADFDHVTVTREPGTDGTDGTEIYEGASTTLTDTLLTVGTQYRYLIVTYDKAGNHSAGVAVVVVGREQLLVSPRDGASVTRPPTLRWLRVSGATYYNVQLWRLPKRSGEGAAATPGTKVYSVWPSKNAVKLKRKWKYAGKRYKLTPGTYRWYVWPGMGPRAKNTYGELIGESDFVVKRKRR